MGREGRRAAEVLRARLPVPCAQRRHHRLLPQGINNGWSDVYDWYIPDQYIEVTGVTDGYYRLEFCADPLNEIKEENEDNNCIVNHIRLSGMSGPAKQVNVIGILKR